MSKLPLVSVVVPCYNHEKYIAKCIASIYQQTYINLQVIVIDDYSKDKSCWILRQLQAQYQFTLIEHSQNWGLPRSLNDAIINYAQGKYIKVVASDDFISNNAVQELVMALEQAGEDCAFAYGRAQKYQYKRNGAISYGQIWGKAMTFKELLYEPSHIPAIAVMFRHKHFLAVGAFPNLPIEDLYLWLKLSEHYKSVFIEQVIGYYQVNSNSGSLSKNYPLMHATTMYIVSEFFIKRFQEERINSDAFFAVMNTYCSDYIVNKIEDYAVSHKLQACYLYFKYLPSLLWKRRKLVFTFWRKIFA